MTTVIQRVASFLVLAGAAAAQTTWIVNASVPGAQPTLAAADAAASDGDVILLRNPFENVSGVQITKSLRIVAESGVLAAGPLPLTVSVAQGKEVVLANLVFATGNLEVVACAGRVTLQECAQFALGGRWGATIRDSTQVLISGCFAQAATPLRVERSRVALDRSTFRGQNEDPETGRLSTPAADFVDATVTGTDTVLTGGNGVAAIRPGSSAFAALRCTLRFAGPGTVVAGGIPSPAYDAVLTDSVLTVEPAFAANVSLLRSVVNRLELPSVAATPFALGSTSTLTLRSPLGTVGALLVAVPGDLAAIPGVTGDLWLHPVVACTAALGVQNGSLSWTVAVPNHPALFAAPFRWQGAVLGTAGPILSDPGATLLR
jgi:hypothetical protein